MRKRRAAVPSAIRQQCWLMHCGKNFEAACKVSWCSNIMTPFTFQVGHNVPHCKGGPQDLSNLLPICAACNQSMGSKWTITEWSKISGRTAKSKRCFPFACVLN